MKKKLNIKKIIIVIMLLLIIVSLIIFMLCANNHKITKISMSAIKNEFLVQEPLLYKHMSEGTINKQNSQYDSIENGNIILFEYSGNEECIVIPEEIDGCKIEKIASSAFTINDNLEIIKIPIEIAKNVDKIDGFSVSEELSDSKYIIYVTTKEYNQEYLRYMKLTDEEKAKTEVIPTKFIIELDEDYSDENVKFPEATATDIPKAYNLKNNINIEADNQGAYGLCYAYAVTKSIETNLALNHNKIRNFSEIHLAMKSKQLYGGWFNTTYASYLRYGYGPAIELPNTLLSQDYVTANRNNNTVARNIYNALTSPNAGISGDQLNHAISVLDSAKQGQEFYVMSYRQFASVYGDKKRNNSYASTVEKNRNSIKESIMKNGSVCAYISTPNNTNYRDYGRTAVEYQAESMSNSAHSVSIIGWDDNFDTFPSEWNIKKKGAWLALNCWGSTWGNGDGTFWISYEDYYVESNNSAITEISEGKVNINNTNITLENTSYIYDGNSKTPYITIKYGNNICSKGVDYTLEYRNNVNAGTATVIINGIGRFIGTVTKEFTILPKPINSAIVTLSESSYTYDGVSKMPTPTVRVENKILLEGTDYTISYKNNINAGTATVIINGIEKFTGTVSKTFTILPKSITEVTVYLSQTSYTCNGTPRMPATTVKDKDKILTIGEDYTVSYSNNINVGTATVTISGKGNYKESKNTTFKIEKGTPKYVIPSGLVAKYNSTLKNVILPSGFSWEDNANTKVGKVGYNTFKCTYKPQDTTNYNIVTGIPVVLRVTEKIGVTIEKYTTKFSDDKKIIYMTDIATDTLLDEIKDKMKTDAIIEIYEPAGKELSADKEKARTGMKVKLQVETESIDYILVVLGDNNGDGKFNSVDLLKLARYLSGLDINLHEEYLYACDVYRDEKINQVDLLKMARIISGLDK